MSVLQYISDLMDELYIPYEFMVWSDETIPDPYFIGEYNEVESATLEECGYQESTFILTGTGTSYSQLEAVKNEIKRVLQRTAILDDGTGIMVSYGYSFSVPTGEEKLKRIQINLIIKEWRVN